MDKAAKGGRPSSGAVKHHWPPNHGRLRPRRCHLAGAGLEDATRSRSLAYDDINRLLMVSEGTPVADGGTPIPVEDYAYDPTGNRTVSHLSTSYTVDDHNRLLSDTTYAYAYDSKGNRTTRTRTSDGRIETFSYDAMNQLTAVTNTDGTAASYAYDALGQRIAKTVGTDTTAYIYDIGNMRDVTTHDILLEYQNATLTRRWLHGQRIDEPLAYEGYTASTAAGAGTAYALHADRQGSVIAVTDQATGTLAARYKYDAFGAREQTVSLVMQPYGFTGREYDGEADLYHYRARTYDPAVGRFLQSDPLGFAAGDLNLYAYTWNDPANWTDPSGLSSTSYGRMSGAITNMTRAAGRTVGQGAKCMAQRLSTMLIAAAPYLVSGDFETAAGMAITQSPTCKTRVRPRKGAAVAGAAKAICWSKHWPSPHPISRSPRGRKC